MIEVIPAILVDNYEELREHISRVASLVSVVQIDICDGKFTPHTSWPMQSSDQASVQGILNEEEGLPYWDSIDFEFDLMLFDRFDAFREFSKFSFFKGFEPGTLN
jgi:pentose-5-phosphate-3-epimerase